MNQTLPQAHAQFKPATFADGYDAGIRGAQLDEMSTPQEAEGWWESRKKQPAMNADAVKIDGGRWDRGAFHRAVAVARELCGMGIWNGQDHITIYDPYVTHNKVFGVGNQPVSALKSGVDYLIIAPVIPHTLPANYQVESDGDIIFA